VQRLEAVVECPDREFQAEADDGEDGVEHRRRGSAEASNQPSGGRQVVQSRLDDGGAGLNLAQPAVGDGGPEPLHGQRVALENRRTDDRDARPLGGEALQIGLAAAVAEIVWIDRGVEGAGVGEDRGHHSAK